jgi:hypothetical protein
MVTFFAKSESSRPSFGNTWAGRLRGDSESAMAINKQGSGVLQD